MIDDEGTIRLGRTYDRNIVSAKCVDAKTGKKYAVTPPKGTQVKIKNGPLESCGLTNYVTPAGSRAVLYHGIPLHRGFASYGMSQDASGTDMFHSDREIEFVTMLDDMEGTFKGEISSGDRIK